MTPWPVLDGAGGFAYTRRHDSASRPRTPAAPKTSGAHPLPSERTGLSQRPLKHPKVGCFQGADRARATVSTSLPAPRRWRFQIVMINSPPPRLGQASENHQATSTLAKPPSPHKVPSSPPTPLHPLPVNRFGTSSIRRGRFRSTRPLTGSPLPGALVATGRRGCTTLPGSRSVLLLFCGLM